MQADEWDDMAGREHGTLSRRVSKTDLSEAADYLSAIGEFDAVVWLRCVARSLED